MPVVLYPRNPFYRHNVQDPDSRRRVPNRLDPWRFPFWISPFPLTGVVTSHRSETVTSIEGEFSSCQHSESRELKSLFQTLTTFLILPIYARSGQQSESGIGNYSQREFMFRSSGSSFFFSVDGLVGSLAAR